MELKKEELEVKKFWKTIFSDWRRIILALVIFSIIVLVAYSLVMMLYFTYPSIFDPSCNYDERYGGYSCLCEEHKTNLSLVYECHTAIKGVLPTLALLLFVSAVPLAAMMYTFSPKEAFVLSGRTIRFRKFFKNAGILVFILGFLLLVFAASAGYIISSLSGAGG